MSENEFETLARNCAFAMPTLLLCVLGIVFAILQREKAPTAAVLLIISLVVLLLLSIIRPISYVILDKMDAGYGLMGIWGFLCSVVDFMATAGLVVAVFLDRGPKSATSDFFSQKPAGSAPSYPAPSYPPPSPKPPPGPPRPPQ